jgi:hypothetical protein
MTNNRTIALDTAFVVAYIGLAAGMVCLSVTLAVLAALGADFSTKHGAALVINAAGWTAVAAAPALYNRLIGAHFSWRQNAVLGDAF